MKIRSTATLVAALVLMQVSPLLGQAGRPWDPTGLQLTRQELQELLATYEQTATSSAYSSTLRDRARAEAVLIRQRLDEGDIRVGDRISLFVEGQTQLSDTFNVVAGRKIVLPDLGEVELAGVLRSELQPYMTAQIGRFIREPTVYARSLIRLEITGSGVGQGGFYIVPSDLLLSDVLMLAGGPSNGARLDKMTIKRGKDIIWDGDRLREATIEGKTLDQLSVRAGDAIDVPSTATRNKLQSMMVVLSSIASAAFLAKRAGIF